VLFKIQPKLPVRHQKFIEENMKPNILNFNLKKVLAMGDGEGAEGQPIIVSNSTLGDLKVMTKLKQISEMLKQNDFVEDVHYKMTNSYSFTGHKA
jgi:hypothetical protein